MIATLPKPTTPQPAVKPSINLGGRNIPVPANKPVSVQPPTTPAVPPFSPAAGVQLKQPTAPLPRAQQTPLAEERNQKLGINPALAPKQAQPLQSTSPTLASRPPLAGGAGMPPKPPQPLGTAPGIKPAGVKQPLMVQIQANPKKWLMIILGAVFGLGLIMFLISQLFGGTRTPVQTNNGTNAPTQQVVLTYWGLWEPSAVLDEVLADYEAANPGIKIDYRVQSHKDYRERLQTAIASGNGPDIFRYHAAWVPMFGEDLAVLPASVMSATDFQSTFYPTAAEQLQIDGKIVGLPMMYDGLALYYNKDILQTAGVEPPATWAELKQLASELTVPADKNERANSGIQRSGLAIGNATNVDHFSDILGLLILQNGGDPAQPAFAEVRDALIFYTNFVLEDNIWSTALPNSTVAFARGDAAMMFAPSWRAHEVMALNPNLNFAIAPLPQLSEEVTTWANYWAEGVNEKGSHKSEAWNFLKYLTSSEVMQKLYSAQSQVRAFGEPYSRQDLASSLETDPYVGAYLKDAPSAKGWYLSSATHDNGLNDNIIGYYATAVNAVLAGDDVEEVLTTLDNGIQQELRQYGLAE
jgi:ABC-type glycerol-3-phosphate transport system substrate-binding protein